MADFLSTIQFALTVTGPIIVILILGIFLARIGILTDAFIDSGSKLVFNVLLPSMLFITISKTGFSGVANFKLITVGIVGTLFVYLRLELLANYLVTPAEERGVVVQGAFRSNMGIIGLAYCVNGCEAGLAAASLYLGIVTILFNVLAVITLNRSLNRHRSMLQSFRDIGTNPLIVGILLALPVAWWEVEIPFVLLRAGDYFAQMTLPFALLVTGASLSLRVLRYETFNAMFASGCKLIFVPVLLTGGGILVGLRGMELGVLFMMTSAPTAAASYVMVRAMGGNPALAANIVVVTTLGSLLFTSIGIASMRGLGLI
ncbi:transporter [Solemya velum gill symbiont]|uniref:AEC family transporter n=1 Tax=Solemya velum gill symbiont TaxID=2340 RepID=UPI0009988C88|nr:AEC family transporter [Solemya velum gill symbiont]OOZ48856.1 transporter [Solemya velum gill symbiont]